MIAQRIRSMSVNTNSPKTSNSKKDVQSYPFDNIISNNLRDNDKTEKQVSQKLQEKLIVSKRYLDEDRCIQQSSGRFDQRKNIKNQSESAELSKNIKESTNVENKTAKAIKDLEDTIKKELKLSDEEFEDMMESLGLTIVDLLNIENIKYLCLKVHGAEDITEVLTNEKLANAMDELLQAVKEFQDSKGSLLSDEQIKNLLDSVHAEDLIHQEEMQKVTEADPMQSNSEKSLNTGIESETKEVLGKYGNAMETVIGKDENVSTLDNIQQEDELIQVSTQNGEENKYNTANSNLFDENTMQDDAIQELIEGQSDQKDSKFEPLNDMNSFIHNLAAATFGKDYMDSEQVSNARMIHNIANQIIEQLKVSVKPDFTSMELQLNPEHLGKVGLSIVSKDGVMTAQFTTQNEMAKEAIESQMHILIENLNNQGLKVESIEVAVSNFTFGESNQTSKGEEQQSNSQSKNHFRNDEEILGNLEGVSGQNEVQSDILEQNGSIIDYSA